MNLQYDEDFVEEVVRLCAAGRCKRIASLQFSRFNRERERLYSILDPDERNAAFFALHLEWFREWRLEEPLTDAMREFPLLAQKLKVLAFRKPHGRNDEGAELYVNDLQARHGVVAMRPERFAAEEGLRAFLRRELMHLHDMLDPAFGYEPDLPVTGPSLSKRRLARERYRLCWDISIDGRLACRGLGTTGTKNQRWIEFSAGFAFWTEGRQQEAFEMLWNDATPTHRMLVNLVRDAHDAQVTEGSGPGAPCALCGFPTFAWAESQSLDERTVRAIIAEFPHWRPEQGLCSRCAAIYRVNQRQFASV